MTQQELADKLGLRQSTVSKWLSGATKPTGLAKAALQAHFPEVYKQILRIHQERNAND